MFAFRPARLLGLSWRGGDNAPLHLVSPSSLLQLRTISDQWPVFLFVDFKVTCCLFSYVGVHTRRQHTGTWIGWPNVCMYICERARACMLAERPLSCIVMHVDKAIRRHVLRMLHARVGLCVRGIGPIGGRPVDFISPHRSIGWRGTRRRGWAFHYFFLAFCPFFPGRPDFALRFFCAAFATRARCFYSLALSHFCYAFCLSLSVCLSLLAARYVYRNVLVSLAASFHTSFLSFKTPIPFPSRSIFSGFCFCFLSTTVCRVARSFCLVSYVTATKSIFDVWMRAVGITFVKQWKLLLPNLKM